MKFKNVILAVVLALSGCQSIPQEALTNVNDNSIISDAFVVKMQKGQTTRDQEQSFIRANRRSWHSENFALNNAPLPPDMQTPGNAGPLDLNLIQALENDLNVRKNMQNLQNAFDSVGSVNSNSK